MDSNGSAVRLSAGQVRHRTEGKIHPFFPRKKCFDPRQHHDQGWKRRRSVFQKETDEVHAGVVVVCAQGPARLHSWVAQVTLVFWGITCWCPKSEGCAPKWLNEIRLGARTLVRKQTFWRNYYIGWTSRGWAWKWRPFAHPVESAQMGAKAAFGKRTLEIGLEIMKLMRPK